MPERRREERLLIVTCVVILNLYDAVRTRQSRHETACSPTGIARSGYEGIISALQKNGGTPAPKQNYTLNTLQSK